MHCEDVRSAVEKASDSDSVAVLGEDVDLLVLLTAPTPTDQNIFFYKPGRGKIETQVISSNRQQQKGLKDVILFAHAFTGCYTTSASFRKGKVASCKLLLLQPLGIASSTRCVQLPKFDA